MEFRIRSKYHYDNGLCLSHVVFRHFEFKQKKFNNNSEKKKLTSDCIFQERKSHSRKCDDNEGLN